MRPVRRRTCPMPIAASAVALTRAAECSRGDLVSLIGSTAARKSGKSVSGTLDTAMNVPPQIDGPGMTEFALPVRSVLKDERPQTRARKMSRSGIGGARFRLVKGLDVEHAFAYRLIFT